MNIEEMTKAVRKVNEDNGWFDHERSFGDGIALLHTELSEAYEAFRDWGMVDVTQFCNKGHGDPGHTCKPEGVGSEMADVLVRLLDECDRQGINLAFEFERKLAYNATRGYHHGGKSI